MRHMLSQSSRLVYGSISHYHTNSTVPSIACHGQCLFQSFVHCSQSDFDIATNGTRLIFLLALIIGGYTIYNERQKT